MVTITVYLLTMVGMFAVGCLTGIRFYKHTANVKAIDRVLDTHVKDRHLRDKLKAVLKIAIN